MLQKLLIRNYILIKELTIEPDKGMNVITGETGAGKSILLGAIGLLMGSRADSKTLFNSEEKCVIEGHFFLNGGQLKEVFAENELDYENPAIVRREISVTGKSRAFVNDTPVNLEQLETIVGELMDIHSQHETIMLKKPNYQIGLLDSFAQNENEKQLYQELYQKFRKAEKRYAELLASARTSAQEQDYITYVFKELDELRLQKGELEKLEEEQKLLENTGEIKEKLAQAHAVLSGDEFAVLSGIQNLCSLFDQLSPYSAELKDFREKLNGIRFDLKDMSKEIESLAEETETDPERLMEVQSRLDLIYKLQRKHSITSYEEFEQLREEFGKKLSLIENTDFVVAEAEKELKSIESSMLMAGGNLTSSRKAAVPVFEKAASEKLSLLGMPNAVFRIRLTEAAPSNEGLEKGVFLFSANKGSDPKPLTDVASGGEISRLMLVIKYLLAGRKEMPTLIFDEIDTGVSGEVAHNMAMMIEEMTERHQVFTITHLPQMASRGQSHFFVYKDDSSDKTVSHIKKLDKEERIKEIAKMIGGKVPSESARQSARELLG